MRVVSIVAQTHGRVLLREAADPKGLLLGFHGYGESAETQMARLESIPGSEHWTLIAIQALNRFYRGRSQDVVASWMTRQDRVEAIEDNIDYVDQVVGTIGGAKGSLVCAGFSQGGAMAFRAAVRAKTAAAGVISVGADVPPELFADDSVQFPKSILLMRGTQDDWYTADKLRADVTRLTKRGNPPHALTYEGGHDWTPEVSAAAGALLQSYVR
jgi:predicted esterase